MNPKVDTYLEEGCGRCPLGGTPQCKVHDWRPELDILRSKVLETGLTEEHKWGVPCYTYRGANVLTLSALKDGCVLSFFKGSLLEDPYGLLEKPGANSQAARYLRFTSTDPAREPWDRVDFYIHQAIEIQQSGKKVEFLRRPEPIPEEFQRRMEGDAELRTAFEALTPGRQRGYILYFSGASKPETREARIDRYIPRILEGKGFHDRD